MNCVSHKNPTRPSQSVRRVKSQVNRVDPPSMDLAALQNLLHSLQSHQDHQPVHHQPAPSTLQIIQPPLATLPPNLPASQLPQSLPQQRAIPPHSASLPTSNHSLPPSPDIFSLLGALKPLNPLPITPVTTTPTPPATANPPTLHSSPSDPQTHPPKRQKLDPRPSSHFRSPSPQPVPHPHPTESCPTTDTDNHLEPGQVTISDALPVLSKLVRNNAFLDAVQLIKERQDEFELRLLDERNRIKSDIERNIKRLNNQQTDQNRNDDKIQKLRNELKDSLNLFDKSCLERWDQLRNQQQVELFNLNVPTFCKTNDPVILSRQRQALEIILGAIVEREEKN